RPLGVALEIDRDVDLALVQQFRDLAVALRAHIVERFEALDQPPPDVAAVIAAERDADHLEARAIMALEQLGNQASGRMLMEISAEIGNADPFVRPTLAGPERSARRADLVVDEGTRALQVEGRIVAEPNERERIDDPFAFGD